MVALKLTELILQKRYELGKKNPPCWLIYAQQNIDTTRLIC